jgi:uncharacterized protein YjbJ (UPF0337 family)
MMKKTLGHLTNNPDLEAQGAGEKIAGKVQKFGQLKKAIERA